jgi:tRNA(His) 5'-end guanylyltransferase
MMIVGSDPRHFTLPHPTMPQSIRVEKLMLVYETFHGNNFHGKMYEKIAQLVASLCSSIFATIAVAVTPGSNPRIVIYNASAVKSYNATTGLVL